MKISIRAILAVLIFACVSLALCACGGCTHENTVTTEENRYPSTCARDGCYDEVVSCADCGEEISRTEMTIPAIAHTESDWILTKDSTCTEGGERQIKCTVCYEVLKTEKIELKEHSPAAPVTEGDTSPTCSSIDNIYYVVVYCDECNGEISREKVERKSIPHTPGEWEVGVDATCIAEGAKHRNCAECGEYLETEIINATGIHVAAAAVVENMVNPTCYAQGSYDEVVYCSTRGCGYEISRSNKTVSKLQHTPAAAVKENGRASTCQLAGYYYEVVYCSVSLCHAEISRVEKPLATSTHIPGEWHTTEEATCKTGGLMAQKCTTCGTTLQTRRTLPKEHTPSAPVNEVKQASTCYSEGRYDEVVYCAIFGCGAEISRTSRTSSVLPHTPGEWDYILEPTCTSEGRRWRRCTVCNNTVDVETVGKIEHSASIYRTEGRVEPTCTKDGSYVQVVYCGNEGCGIEVSRSTKTLAKTGHKTTWITISEATCAIDGLASEVCRVCSDVVSTKAIPATGEHIDIDVKIANRIESTCISQGSYDEISYCLHPTCGAIISTNKCYLPLAEHTQGREETKNYKDSTCISTGSYDLVTYCGTEGCGAVISTVKNTISQKPHNYSDYLMENVVPATCIEDGSHEEVRYCMNDYCRIERDRTRYEDAYTGHTYEGDYCKNCGEHVPSKGLNYVRTFDIYESVVYSGVYVDIGNCTDKDIYIPTIAPDGSRVIGISSYGFSKSDIRSVTIPYGIQFISLCAFMQCENIKSIVIPSSVISIDNSAFASCSSLETVVIEDGVKRILDYAFEHDVSIKNIVIPDSVIVLGNGVFSGCTGLITAVIGNGVEEINSEIITNCTSLVSLTLGSGIKHVRGFGFGGELLAEIVNNSSIEIPIRTENGHIDPDVHSGESRIVRQGDFIFYPSSDGTNYLVCGFGISGALVLPASYNGESYAIGDYAFSRNTAITSVVIPDGVTYVGGSSFLDCTGIVDLVIGDGAKGIGKNAFYRCSRIRRAVIGDGVVNIGSYAFYACTDLMSLTIGESYEGAGDDTFRGCISLVEVIDKSNKLTRLDDADYVIEIHRAESRITEVDGFFFYTHTNGSVYLVNYIGTGTELVLPTISSVDQYVIQAHAFSGLQSITSVVIPDCVTRIEKSAFSNCTSLISVNIGDGVTYIAHGAFAQSGSLRDVKIGKGLSNLSQGVFESSVAVPDENGVYYIDKWVYSCTSTASVITLRADTEGIFEYAFAYLDTLEQIVLPDTLIAISSYAFRDCYALKSVVIPGGVSRLCIGAFYNCSALESVTLCEGVSEMDEHVFNGCASLSSIRIPASLVKIGYRAFHLTGIESAEFECTVGWYKDTIAISSEIMADPIEAAGVLTASYSQLAIKSALH